MNAKMEQEAKVDLVQQVIDRVRKQKPIVWVATYQHEDEVISEQTTFNMSLFHDESIPFVTESVNAMKEMITEKFISDHGHVPSQIKLLDE